MILFAIYYLKNYCSTLVVVRNKCTEKVCCCLIFCSWFTARIRLFQNILCHTHLQQPFCDMSVEKTITTAKYLPTPIRTCTSHGVTCRNLIYYSSHCITGIWALCQRHRGLIRCAALCFDNTKAVGSFRVLRIIISEDLYSALFHYWRDRRLIVLKNECNVSARWVQIHCRVFQ